MIEQTDADVFGSMRWNIVSAVRTQLVDDAHVPVGEVEVLAL